MLRTLVLALAPSLALLTALGAMEWWLRAALRRSARRTAQRESDGVIGLAGLTGTPEDRRALTASCRQLP